MAVLKPPVLVIVPALSTVEGPPLVEPPLALIERPVKPPVIVPPIELTTVEPPPSSAPLRPAVIVPEFVRVNDTSPVTALPVAVMVPWLVTAQPGLATEATPVPAAVTVAPLTTVALVMPGAVAQPADPRTMGTICTGDDPVGIAGGLRCVAKGKQGNRQHHCAHGSGHDGRDLPRQEEDIQ